MALSLDIYRIIYDYFTQNTRLRLDLGLVKIPNFQFFFYMNIPHKNLIENIPR
jgi:hypothetical protein